MPSRPRKPNQVPGWPVLWPVLLTLACNPGAGGTRRATRDAGPDRDTDADTIAADAGTPWYDWSLQFGSEGSDAFRAVAFDGASHVFASGVTYGALPGFANAGVGDVIVARIEVESGAVVWQQQFGTEFEDVATAVALDASGSLYLAGTTAGALGGMDAMQTDAFVLKASAATGERDWVTQLQTDGYDGAVALAALQGDVVVLGQTDGELTTGAAGYGDYFLARLRGESGARVWAVQFGTEVLDTPTDLALLDEEILVTGYTEGQLGGERSLGLGDAFLSRHSTVDGEWRSTRLLGTDAFDMGHSVAVDETGNVYVAGETEGSSSGANLGATDAFLTKLGVAGEPAWSKQFGTETWDFALDVGVADGRVITSGDTYGSLAPNVVKGRDVFVRSFAEGDGESLAARQFGTVAHDFSHDVAIGPKAAAIVVGSTPTGLIGPSGLGSFDAFAIAIPVPR